MKLKQILGGALLIGAGYGFYWLRTNVSPEVAALVLGYVLGIITCVVLYTLAHQTLLGAIGHLKGVLAPSIKEQARTDGVAYREQMKTQGAYDRAAIRNQPTYVAPTPPPPPTAAEQFFQQNAHLRM